MTIKVYEIDTNKKYVMLYDGLEPEQLETFMGVVEDWLENDQPFLLIPEFAIKLMRVEDGEEN